MITFSRFFFKNVLSVKYANGNIILHISFIKISLYTIAKFNLEISFDAPFMGAILTIKFE